VKKELQNKETLKEFALDLGVDLFGIADIAEARNEFNLDRQLREGFHRGIALGKRVLSAVLDDIQDRPTALYFHHYRQLNFFLDRAAFLISAFIQDKGFRALPIPASQIVYWDKQQAHVSHKKVAYLAGLGWIGRNNLLVHPQARSHFRLVTVLTDMPLKPDHPVEGNCGRCYKCLRTCPAGAIKTLPEDFDHLACFEKLKEFRRLGIVSQFICGVCVKACGGRSGSKAV
jgi:epoxyqueuosine reductase QueG